MNLKIYEDKELLARTIYACEELIEGYTKREGSVFCPLCFATNGCRSCALCPWEVIEGYHCKYNIPSISMIRTRPGKHPEEADKAIERLNKWLVILKGI